MVEETYFPYTEGPRFIAEVIGPAALRQVVQTGAGYGPQVNRLFENPPQSTAQILHPVRQLIHSGNLLDLPGPGLMPSRLAAWRPAAALGLLARADGTLSLPIADHEGVDSAQLAQGVLSPAEICVEDQLAVGRGRKPEPPRDLRPVVEQAVEECRATAMPREVRPIGAVSVGAVAAGDQLEVSARRRHREPVLVRVASLVHLANGRALRRCHRAPAIPS